MKITLVVIWILSAGFSGFADGFPAFPDSLSNQVRDAEVIALVTIPTVKSFTSKNPAGQVVTTFSGEAEVEQVFKGAPPKKIQIKDKSAASLLEQHHDASIHYFRYLVFVKRSGDFYTTSGKDDLAPVFGSTPGGRRVVWRLMCMSDDEAAAVIKEALKK